MNAREAAYSALLRYENNASYSNIELDGTIKKYGLSGVEKSFFTALFYGVIERTITLDYYISALSERKIEEIDKNILVILRMGMYQLIYMTKVPESAAVNESVTLARRFYARKNSENFVNAVLRTFIREKGKIKLPDKQKEPIKYLSVKYAMPEWICEIFKRDYGYARAEKILGSMNSSPNITLRVNTLKTTREALREKLAADGIKTEFTEFSKNGLRLSSSVPYSSISKYEDEFFVQDEASQLCVEALDAKAGEKILDACACPGGKSFGIAMQMENDGEIISADLHKNKLSLIEKGAERLGISIIRTKERNAATAEEDSETYDRILLDVPCSGLGVIAKKPDIRRKNESDIERLPEIQKNILENSAKLLKKGGTLVYSTCTINKRENADIIDAFLKEHKEFSLEPFALSSLSFDGKAEFLPDERETDGFFIAKLKKAK